jgi:hypothetical protein
VGIDVNVHITPERPVHDQGVPVKLTRHRLWLAGVFAVAVGAIGIVTATSAQAATGCKVKRTRLPASPM